MIGREPGQEKKKTTATTMMVRVTTTTTTIWIVAAELEKTWLRMKEGML
jgi:hypothetical protein